MAALIALLILLIAGGAVLGPLFLQAQQVRNERLRVQREADAANQVDCDHTYSPWEFADTSILHNDEGTGAVGRTYTQKRDCLVCGYTQMHSKTLTN